MRFEVQLDHGDGFVEAVYGDLKSALCLRVVLGDKVVFETKDLEDFDYRVRNMAAMSGSVEQIFVATLKGVWFFIHDNGFVKVMSEPDETGIYGGMEQIGA